MYNITLRCVSETTVAVEKHYISHISVCESTLMYVCRWVRARWRECVLVSVYLYLSSMQHTYTIFVICGLCGSTTFFDTTS
jgi:hypothetical protein